MLGTHTHIMSHPLDSIRDTLRCLLYDEATASAGPCPHIENTDGHKFVVNICLGKQKDFYRIGNWIYVVCAPFY